MSTQSEILIFGSNPSDRGFAVSDNEVSCGGADYSFGRDPERRNHDQELDQKLADESPNLNGLRPNDDPTQCHTQRDDNGSVPAGRGRPHIEIPPGTSLEDLERAAVEQALRVHRGNRTHAAKTLGISVRTLQRKLKAWSSPALTFGRQSPRAEFSTQFVG
jgi:Bacterial regulatory protein, Fis family